MRKRPRGSKRVEKEEQAKRDRKIEKMRREGKWRGREREKAEEMNRK